MENWEALDVDDSDLPSLLRPCITTNKRKHPTTLSLNPSQNSSTNPPSQTLISLQPPQGETDSVVRRRIPGPAGAVQVAMERKRRVDSGGGAEEVSTQECIRRAVENNGDGDDGGDFRLGPWTCAVEFVTRQGPLPSITPLNSIPKFLDIGRIDQIVAVIKSCMPNGLGDLMVTLKDPTGKIGASIHRKVFADDELGKEIFVGSVFILQKVAVFAPSRSALYLNITRNNVVKVFSKDSGPPTKQNTYIPAVKSTTGLCKETSVNLEEATSMEVEMPQRINTGTEQCLNLTSSVNNINKEMEKNNNNTHSFAKCDRENDTSAEKILKKVFGKENIRDEQRGLNDAAELDECRNIEEISRTNGVEKEKQLLTSSTAFPEWTDEQLNQLFSADYEDDGSFF